MFAPLTRRLLALAASPWAEAVLMLVAFAESSFFPLPAELLFVPMCLARPDRALRYAVLTAAASIAGGAFGWLIGRYLFELVALPALEFWHAVPTFEALKAQTGEGTILALLITSGAAHLPPMKVVSILAGVIDFNFWLFLLAAVVARGTKFLLLGWALTRYGEAVADVIHRRLALVAGIAIVVLAALWAASRIV
jgi:membrane protein YqaA with SNARE-associated domain